MALEQMTGGRLARTGFGWQAAALAVAGSAAAAVPVPPAIHADGVPAIPAATAEASARYLELFGPAP